MVCEYAKAANVIAVVVFRSLTNEGVSLTIFHIYQKQIIVSSSPYDYCNFVTS